MWVNNSGNKTIQESCTVQKMFSIKDFFSNFTKEWKTSFFVHWWMKDRKGKNNYMSLQQYLKHIWVRFHRMWSSLFKINFFLHQQRGSWIINQSSAVAMQTFKKLSTFTSTVGIINYYPNYNWGKTLCLLLSFSKEAFLEAASGGVL